MVRRAARKSKRTVRRAPRRRTQKKTHKKTKMTLYSSIGGVMTTFPKTLRTKFTYTDNFTLTQTGGVGLPVARVYRMNSCFDPDYTGAGGQPRYFDSLCGPTNGTAPYLNYRVIHSSISCKVFPTSSAATDANCLFAIIPSNSPTDIAGTVDEMRHRPNAKFAYIAGIGSYKPYSVRNSGAIKSFLAIKDLQDDATTYAAYNANPATALYWQLTQSAIADAGNAITYVLMAMTLTVEFFNLNDVADS